MGGAELFPLSPTADGQVLWGLCGDSTAQNRSQGRGKLVPGGAVTELHQRVGLEDYLRTRESSVRQGGKQGQHPNGKGMLVSTFSNRTGGSMAGKNFWGEKWLKDQYNQRNPGQANHPDNRPGSQTISPPPPTSARPQSAPTRGGKKK
jgi:hypothetical protein